MLTQRLSDESAELQVAAADLRNTCSVLHTVQEVAILNRKSADFLDNLFTNF